MNWLDIIIIIALVISTFMGLKRGFVRSLVPLICIVIAIPLAGVLSNPLAGKIGDNAGSHVAAFVIIFVAVFVAVYIGAWFLQKVLQIMLLGWADRLGGAAFGLIMGWLMCSMLVVLVARYGALDADLGSYAGSGMAENVVNANIRSESIYNTINDSKLARAQIDSFPVILGLLPGEFDKVSDFFGD